MWNGVLTFVNITEKVFRYLCFKGVCNIQTLITFFCDVVYKPKSSRSFPYIALGLMELHVPWAVATQHKNETSHKSDQSIFFIKDYNYRQRV